MPDEDLHLQLAHMQDALALLGARPCIHCGKYFLTADPSNLFNAGPNANAERVCYHCIQSWWHDRCPTLSVPDRIPRRQGLPRPQRLTTRGHPGRPPHPGLRRMRRHRYPRRRPLPPLRRQPQRLGHHLQKSLPAIAPISLTPNTLYPSKQTLDVRAGLHGIFTGLGPSCPPS
jgi:hypothetical protein